MIVTTKLFEGTLAIGQIEQAHIAARVQWFIDEYEPLFLRMLLGRELAELLKTEFEKPEHDTKWNELAKQIEPMAVRYVYCYYKSNSENLSAGVGSVKPRAKNATREPEINNTIPRWNEMVDMVMAFQHWINNRKSDYPKHRHQISAICKYKNSFGI